MAKDIANIRKEQAKKEREHIASLQKEAQLPKKPQIVLSQDPEGKSDPIANNSEEVSPIPAKAKQFAPSSRGSSVETTRPSQAVDLNPKNQKKLKRRLLPSRPLKRSEKLFIRLVVGGIIVFLIFNTVAFGFWYFLNRGVQQQPKSQNIQQQLETPLVPEPRPSIENLSPDPQLPDPKPEILVPQVKTSTMFFEIPEQEIFLEIPEKLLLNLQDFLLSGPVLGFTNLVVKIEGDILSLKEFLQETQITIPKEFKEKLGEDLMLFSYVTENKKRLGFIVEIKKMQDVPEQEIFSGLLRSWEQSMEQDLASFFGIIGKKGSAYTPFFRSTTYRGVKIRFQTFSVVDFGIVYGIAHDKLLFTSSLETFQQTVDRLQGI